MKFSSAFKVGLLTIASIVILVFTVMWIKGRALSSGERITVNFRDVNGLRAGSGVQMMGYRVGQVEEITPVIQGENSYVKVKFVIIEPNIQIPLASEISIQQSGLIGEQFLEVMPPRIKNIYLPVLKNSDALKINDKVEMILSNELRTVGVVKSVEIIPTESLSILLNENIKTEYAYKVSYIITMPGLKLPHKVIGEIISKDKETKLKISPESKIKLLLPKTESKYTVIEPMRLADFMDLQYRSAESLTEMNNKISSVLSEEVISDLQNTAKNLEDLTVQAKSTFEKAALLIDTTRKELETTMESVNNLTTRVMAMTDNINSVIGDKNFKEQVVSTTAHIERLSININNLLEDEKTKQTLDNINAISKNINDISLFVNNMSQDESLKSKLSTTVNNFNGALVQLETTLSTVNSVTEEDKDLLKDTINDAYETSKNLRKFSEKLNKHFLVFRLLF